MLESGGPLQRKLNFCLRTVLYNKIQNQCYNEVLVYYVTGMGAICVWIYVGSSWMIFVDFQLIFVSFRLVNYYFWIIIALLTSGYRILLRYSSLLLNMDYPHLHPFWNLSICLCTHLTVIIFSHVYNVHTRVNSCSRSTLSPRRCPGMYENACSNTGYGTTTIHVRPNHCLQIVSLINHRPMWTWMNVRTINLKI